VESQRFLHGDLQCSAKPIANAVLTVQESQSREEAPKSLIQHGIRLCRQPRLKVMEHLLLETAVTKGH
jgi:hypothetical protein